MNDAVETVAKKEKTVITTVTMTDGRIVEFSGKQKMKKEAFLTEDGYVAVVFDLVNGQTRTFVCPPELLKKAAGHGLSQKIGDDCAGLDEVEDFVVAIDKRIELLTKLDWNAPREAGVQGTSELQIAMMRISGKSAEDTKAYLANLKPEEKLALRANAKIAPVIAQIKVERAAKSTSKKPPVDTEALLGGFLG